MPLNLISSALSFPTPRHSVLVAIDRPSRFPFAACCAAPTAELVTRFLSELHLLIGLPSALRSDQGMAFTSTHLQQWCANNGVNHIYSSVGDHRGTGLLERRIRTLCSRLGTCRLTEPTPPFPALLHRIFYDIRTCSNATTGVSPFQCLFCSAYL